MVQKLLVGLLVLTVIGAIGVGVYDSSQNGDDANSVLAQDGTAQPASTNDVTTIAAEPAANSAQPNAQAADATTTTASAQPVQQQALDNVGVPWAGSGTIVGFDQAGMTLESADMSQMYVELGPQNYWPAQDVQLIAGDSVTVMGFYNGEQYHAATVIKADGSQLALRTAEGLPLWSGGANGNGSHEDDGTASTEPQVAAEDWITVEGTVALVNNSALTLQTSNGKSLELQLGQPRFIEEQGISFVEGDAIRVIGYWQGTAFKAGEVTKLATGERLMLLDPNGRPLWGGPGRNGATQGQTAQTGNPTDATTTDASVSTTDAGQGQGQGSSGNVGSGGNGGGNGGGGNGYQGGRNAEFQAGSTNQSGQ